MVSLPAISIHYCSSIFFQISTQLLVSQTLVSLSPVFFRFEDVSILRNHMARELSLVIPLLTTYLAGLPLLPSPPSHLEIPSFQHLGNCLRLFDAFLLRRWDQGRGGASHIICEHDEDIATGLVSLCLVAEALTINEQSSVKRETGEPCTQVCLQHLLIWCHSPWMHRRDITGSC